MGCDRCGFVSENVVWVGSGKDVVDDEGWRCVCNYLCRSCFRSWLSSDFGVEDLGEEF